MKNKTPWHVLLPMLLFACAQSNEPTVQPVTVTATIDLGEIKFIDQDLGRIASGDSPFEYLYIELFNTGQTYFVDGLTASGIYTYSDLPTILEFTVLQDEVYSLTMKTVGKGTGFGLAETVNVTNQINYSNPVYTIFPNGTHEVYSDSDSLESTQHHNPELDIYYSQNNFSISTASDSIGFAFNRMAFGVEVNIIDCEDGILTVVLNDFNETKFMLDYPTENTEFKVLALQSNYPSDYVADPINIASDLISTKIWYQAQIDADTVILFDDYLLYQRLKTKRIEIDLPTIATPDTLSGNASWVNFSEQALAPGDTVTVD